MSMHNFKLCIIDLDPIVYRAGFSVESKNKEMDIIEVEPLSHAVYNVNSMINYCLNQSGTQEYKGYLTASGRGNFRFGIFPDYKSNRIGSRRPHWYSEIRDYMVEHKGAIVIEGQEADDACSIEHCKENNFGFHPDIVNSIVWSFDKDFNNIPGWHGNFATKQIYYVEEIQALRNFYLQILTGDTSDGIPRIKKGWRQKEAEEEINKAEEEDTLRQIVKSHIGRTLESKTDIEVNKIMTDRGRLVWLRRQPEELWT